MVYFCNDRVRWAAGVGDQIGDGVAGTDDSKVIKHVSRGRSDQSVPDSESYSIGIARCWERDGRKRVQLPGVMLGMLIVDVTNKCGPIGIPPPTVTPLPLTLNLVGALFCAGRMLPPAVLLNRPEAPDQ